jgi:hypothetical protein
MVHQPIDDRRKCSEVGFIGARYSSLEVIHEDRQNEGLSLVIVVDVPARGDPRLEGFDRLARDASVIGCNRVSCRAAMIAES